MKQKILNVLFCGGVDKVFWKFIGEKDREFLRGRFRDQT